jgi:sulfur-oxidizing protein SoxY
MALYLTRRQKLSACIGALGMAVLGRSSSVAHADQSAVDQLIRQFTRGRTPVVDRVRLEVPAVNDDGSAVPLTVAVDIPSTENTHVTEVLVVADGNTRPAVVSFRFSRESVAEASTRMRLAKPVSGLQNVTAVARLSDGACYAITKTVTVAAAGCG